MAHNIMGEFDLIRQYFSKKYLERDDILQSVGDDCAVVRLLPNEYLAVTTDTLAVGTHFLPSISPSDLAHKAIAVNLSDLAAMGAKPAWVSLALTLPHLEEQWLKEFSNSLFEILDHYHVALIGGDTTKGALSITVTAQGKLIAGKCLFRSQAQVGDYIYVSGCLGDSAAGLALLLNQTEILHSSQHYLLSRHLRPIPRVNLGQLLTAYSRCAVDISDGLLADLGHILEKSQCGAELQLDKLPLSAQLLENYSLENAEKFALSGGEDYELCFTISDEYKVAFDNALKTADVDCHCIGRIVDKSGITLMRQGNIVPNPIHIGFDHFGE